MNESSVVKEEKDELNKNHEELIKDIIREANLLPKSPAGEKDNLDIIKHLLKRLAVHQIILEQKTNRTNFWLLVLTIISAIGVLVSATIACWPLISPIIAITKR